MEMWVRILNLPFGWMNERRGVRAAGLIGEVVRMDVDGDGEASVAFLRARVLVEVDKPLRRGILLKPDKTSKPEWFQIQYEKLPFYCFSCGRMGHTEMECPTPAPRNAQGKLPYDLRLRAPEEKRRKLQSFSQAAADFFDSSMGTKKTTSSRSNSDKRSSNEARGKGVADEDVTSPLKENGKQASSGGLDPKNLFNDIDMRGDNFSQRKRKPADNSGGTPDLNLPASELALVPSGFVTDRLAQLGSSSGRVGEDTEVQKKQKINSSNRARSVAVAGSDPRRAQ